MTPDERALRARIAAHALHAQRDGREITAAARGKFLDRFARMVDPDLTLPEDERDRRARSALKAHMLSLSLRSAAARRRRREDA